MDDAELDARLPGLNDEHRDSESRHRSAMAIVVQGSLLTPAPESFAEHPTGLEGHAVLINLINCEYPSSSTISHLIRYADAAIPRWLAAHGMVG